MFPAYRNQSVDLLCKNIPEWSILPIFIEIWSYWLFFLQACNFTKSNTLPWAFFTFFKFHKWYQILKNITYATPDSVFSDELPCAWLQSKRKSSSSSEKTESSSTKVFCKKGVPRNFEKFTRKHLSLKLQGRGTKHKARRLLLFMCFLVMGTP